MPTNSSIYSTPRHAQILAGAEADRRERIESAWAVGHDLAAEKYGADAVPGYFGPEGGNGLMRQLQESPEGVTAAALLGLVKAHLGIEEEAKPAPAPAKPAEKAHDQEGHE